MKKELISMIEQMDESKAENIYYFIKEAFDSSEESIKDEEAVESKKNFKPEELKKMRRVINHMYMDEIDRACYMYDLADEIISNELSIDTAMFNLASKKGAVYLMGREEGIRQERAKKKAIAKRPNNAMTCV